MEKIINTKKYAFLIFAVIFLLGSFLRLYKLGATSFTADEFLGVNTAYGYLKTGEWRRWDFNLEKVADDKPYAHTIFDLSGSDEAESGSYTRAWIFNWQIAEFLRALPARAESSYRLASALWGIITIYIIYFVAKFFSKKREIGLLSAFLFAINISAIVLDRKVRMYSMFFPIYLLFSYYLYQFIENSQNFKNGSIKKLHELFGLNFLYFVPLVISGLLSFHLHLLSANIFFVIFFYLLARSIFFYKKEGKIFNLYAKYLAILIVLCVTAIVFANNQVAPFLSSFQLTNHYSYVAKILSDYSNGVIFMVIMLLGGVYLWKSSQKEASFIIASFVVPLIMAIFFWNRVPGNQYIFFIKSFQIIIIASGIYYLIEFFTRNFPSRKNAAYLITLLASLIIIPNYTYFFQENNTYFQNSRSEEPNYRKVFTYYLKNKKDNEVLVTRWFRNFYFPKANAKLVTYGGERSATDEKKVNADRLMQIQNSNPCGWFIWSVSDDAYITADAKEYARKNFEEINDPQVRGAITVNYWCNK